MSEFDELPAPAKLNLFLHVTGRRADGYHLLETAFRFIDHGDAISLRLREDGLIRLARPLPGVAPETDLTVRAAKLLQAESKTGAGAEIDVSKRLPMGGGLGGGSSDAATVLMGLNRLWNTGFRRQQLMALGLRLGADVPVFIFGQSAYAQGIGEELSPLHLPPAWYLVLTPPVQVATAEVFADPGLTRDSKPIKIAGFSTGAGHNDLQPVVTRRFPPVAECLAWLSQFGDARMTGSGACVFCAFDSQSEAREVLARAPENIRGFVARGLDRHPLYEWVND